MCRASVPILQVAILLVGLFWSANVALRLAKTGNQPVFRQALPLLAFCLVFSLCHAVAAGWIDECAKNGWHGLFVIVLLAAAVAIPVGAWWVRSRGVVIHARMAETGGWTPENLTARVGQPLHLRLTSDDVMHGFAVGQSDQPAVDVKPGEMTEITLTFDRPGKYTFYCTRWCSLNHWRMRGTIEVTGPETTIRAS